MSDPVDFSRVKLALHFDGSDNSTTFTDSSSSARTVTRVNALIKTAQSKFGGASGYFDGSGDYLSVPDSSDFNFGSGDWTIEFWVRPDSISTTRYLIGRGLDSAGSGFYPFNIYISAPGNIIGRCHDGTSDYSTPSAAMSVGVWKHVALVRYSNALKLYVDGVATGSGVAITTALATATDAICIGNASVAFAAGAGSAVGANGYLDDLRITKGEALYTGNFTPPSAAFLNTGDREAYAKDSGPLGAVLAVGSSPPALMSSDAGPLSAVQGLGAVNVLAYSSAAGPFGGALVLAQQFAVVCAADGPLGAAEAVARQLVGSAAASGPLGSALALVFHDYTEQLEAAGAVTFYVCDLVDGAVVTRVPISSWQGTLQTAGSAYLQAVIPAVASLAETIAGLSLLAEFVIYRGARLPDGATIEQEMARSLVETVQFDRGPQRYTCTISGYSDAIAPPATAEPATDRTLRGVRSISSGEGNIRVRCAVDWFLRPGQVAIVEGVPFVASYLNYYALARESYMDVGETAV